MPAKNARVSVVLEKPLLDILHKRAKRDGLSVSMETRDLIRKALEDDEDAYWSLEADARLSKLDRKKLISHKDFWKQLGV